MTSMYASFGRRLVLVSRTALRRPSGSSVNVAGVRRGMASDAHAGAKKKSDMPWLISSGAITVLGAAYLLTPPSKKAAHHVAVGPHSSDIAHATATPPGTGEEKGPKPAEPMKDDEGEEASGEAVGASMSQAYKTDSPKDAKSAEESGTSGPPPPSTDDEGEEASSDDVNKSMKQAFKTDAPKDAKAAEEDSARFDDGAPGQTSAVHDQPTEQKEKPGKKAGQPESPSPMGEARSQARGKNAPKEASEQPGGAK